MTDTAPGARQSAPKAESSEKAATAWTAVLIVIACIAFVSLQAYRILDQRYELLEEDRKDTANLTRSLTQQAELTFRAADVLLVAAVFNLEHGGLEANNRIALKNWLTEEVQHSSQFRSFAVFDHNGDMVTNSAVEDANLNGSSRDYFSYHRNHNDRELRISAPVRGLATHEWIIPVTRRYNRPDGSFGGVIVASVNPKFFLEVYEGLDIGKNGAIVLASLEKKMLVRRPFEDANMGRDMSGGIFKYIDDKPAGSVTFASKVDGILRFNSYQRGKTYPIMVTVAQDVEETLAPWRRSMVRQLIETGSMIALMLVLGTIIWRTTRRLAAKASDLREVNDRFVTAIDTMTHGLTLFDAEGKLVISNKRFHEFYSLSSANIWPGMTYVEYLQEGLRHGSRVEKPLLDSVSLEGADAPFTYMAHDGRMMLVRRTVTPDGGWVSTHEDITGREKAAAVLAERLDELTNARNRLEAQKSELIATSEALSAAKDAAETASRAKSDFLAMMSHEIRTPMAGMMGMIHLLSETELNREQQQLADTAQQSARNLLTVVNDILDFSKLEAGQVTAEAIDFEVETPIRSVAALLGPKAHEQGLALQTSLAPDIPKVLKGDPSRISQILLNLVGNGIKFTETGSVTVAASHRLLDNGAIELRIAVTDTGVGLPAETLKTLFNPFTQADTSVSRKYGGTGLGLAICKRLCETMGGAIGVESEPGRGSTFWFTVKCQAGDEAPAVAAPPLAPAIDVEASALAILVAEDNAINRTLISKLLARRGYQVELVDNGRKAVEAVQRKRYGLVLMDMQMPIMDGISATQAIRCLSGPERDVPIVALTANALVGQREICLAAGMNSFLTKPIQPDALYEAILRWGVSEAAECEACDGCEGG